GLEGRAEPGHIAIVAEDAGHDAVISIDDDGVGMDPDVVRDILAGDSTDRVGIGIGNVDERLRAVCGDEDGPVIETGLGAGPEARMRVPNYRPRVHVTGPGTR